MTFDQRLTWSKHIDILDISSRATLRIRILKKLAGTQWGANLKTFKQVYIGSVGPVLEYGTSTFGTAASAALQKLDKIKNTGLRIISGGVKSTPINEMKNLAGLKSLEEKKNCHASNNGINYFFQMVEFSKGCEMITKGDEYYNLCILIRERSPLRHEDTDKNFTSHNSQKISMV